MKFAIVAALMAAVSGAATDTCEHVHFDVYKKKDCKDADVDTALTTEFNAKLVGADDTALNTCVHKSYANKDYYYKASCPKEAEPSKRIMTIQLYKDAACSSDKKIKEALVKYTMDATKDADGATDNAADRTCTAIKGAKDLWYTGKYATAAFP